MLNLTENAGLASSPASDISPRRADRRTDSAESLQRELFVAHLPLVRSVVERIRVTLPAHIDADDLVSIGITGLSSAIQRFDPAQGSTFGSFASKRIRGAILDELRRMDDMSRGARQKSKELAEVITNLEQRLGRPAKDAEVAKALSLSLEEYAELRDRVRPIVHLDLDAPAPDSDGEQPLHETIPDETQASALEALQRRELVGVLAEHFERLPDQQRKVLAMYYFEELRLAEIAVVFGVTESRICQIHARAIASLRSSLQSALSR